MGSVATYRNEISRVFYAWVLFWLAIRFQAHLLFPQFDHPVLRKIAYDVTFAGVQWSGLAHLITHDAYWGWVLTSLLFFLILILLIRPGLRYLPVLVTFLLLLLEIITNIFVTHSMDYLSVLIILSVAFWGRKEGVFDLLWSAVRYYCCWLYSSAFLWKIILGSMTRWDSGILFTQGNLANYLLLNPHTTLAHFYYFFFQHTWLINFGERVVFLFEGLFLIGFFTRRWDRLLIVAEFMIFLSTMLFSDVFFAEQFIVILPFVGVKTWQRINNIFNYRMGN